MTDVPLDAWYYDPKTGASVIDPRWGYELWREHHEAKAAAKRLAGADAQIKAIIGDGSSLVTLDGRGVAVLARSVRKDLDRSVLAELLGVAPADLDKAWKAAKILERKIATLQVADTLGPDPEDQADR